MNDVIEREESPVYRFKQDTFSLFKINEPRIHDESLIVYVDAAMPRMVQGVWPVSEVYSSLQNAFDAACEKLRCEHAIDIQLLNDVIEWQAQTIDYNALQQALQLGAIDEEEFHAEAEKFIYPEVELDEKVAAATIARLQNVLRHPLSLSDLSNLLSVDLDELLNSKLIGRETAKLGS